MAYPFLPGRPMRETDADSSDWNELARSLGHFLAALHQIPPSTLAGLEHRPSLSGRSELLKIRDATAPILSERLVRAELVQLERWWEQLVADSSMQEFPIVVTHQDFWHGNLLIETEPIRLSGVVDWENARLGDPAADLAPLNYLDGSFAIKVIAAYQEYGGITDENFWSRRAKHRVLREFGGLRYAIRHDDQNELVESIEKLRNTGVTGL